MLRKYKDTIYRLSQVLIGKEYMNFFNFFLNFILFNANEKNIFDGGEKEKKLELIKHKFHISSCKGAKMSYGRIFLISK